MESASAQGVAVVDIGAHKLEMHAQQALRRAWRMSGGRPLGATYVLRACIAVGRSEAFTTLSSLLPLTAKMPPEAPDVAPLNLGAVALEPPLAESFYVAESFFADEVSDEVSAIWGRDLVTMALLSPGDPSLDELAAQAGTTIDDIRAAWLQFLRMSGQHRRPADEWDRWWRAAGLTPAGQTPTQTTEGTAYLLTWNPARYSESEIAEQLKSRDQQGHITFGWSSGNNRSMNPGERVFLLRQGKDLPGLVGVGSVAAAPQQQAHWDKSRRAEGRTSWIVRVRWEAIAIEPIVELSTLVTTTGESDLWRTQVGGISIPASVRGRLEEIWLGAWERHEHNLDPVHVSDLTPKQLIARFNPDHGTAPDSLNVQRYIDAFARIAISRTLTPPMSVGIFGDWGTGKTFFMAGIETKIKELVDGEEGVDEDMYVRNVCHVSFNAWHYAETDLWASLVSTIFKELRRHVDGEADDADEFNKLLRQLELAGALRAQASEHLANVKAEQENAQALVNDARTKLEKLSKPEPLTDDQLRAILNKNVKDVLTGPEDSSDKLLDLLEEAYKLTGDETFNEAHKRVKSGEATVEEANKLLVETRALVSRTGFWWRLLTTAKVHRTPWFWAVLVVAVAIPVVFVVIQSQVDFPIGWSAGLLEAITVVGAVVAWARMTLARAAPVFGALDRIQGNIEREIEDAQSTVRRQYEEAKARNDAARRELEQAEESLADASRNVEAAQAALNESTSQARLGRFIRERATSADYDKYLGLIAMIHRDFEKLSNLMVPAEGKADPTLPRVDRIVLYIDDLDRCYPPTKVVRVLEAVHLLLSFPLFVVFVGVDSRWVSRSLNRHYDQMLRDEAVDVDGSSSVRAPANSQDFLEKIFQVPFWLRRMDTPAVHRMIHCLISADEVEPDDHRLDVDQLGEGGDGAGKGGEDGAGKGGEDGAGQSIDDAAPVATPTPPTKAGPALVAGGAEAYGESIGEPAAPPTEALRIRQAERDFMDEVAPLMPRTPRAIKRFVNIYRLYKAALSTPGLEKFVGSPEHPGNFRAVQVLLALVIGTPDFAKAVLKILDEVEESSTQRLSDIAQRLESSTDPTWQTTLAALATFATDDNNLTLDSLRDVSALVTRYSLHHMVSAVPGESTLSRV
jgi:KAP family P-loop domain